jgi:hypothetical protein
MPSFLATYLLDLLGAELSIGVTATLLFAANTDVEFDNITNKHKKNKKEFCIFIMLHRSYL